MNLLNIVRAILACTVVSALVVGGPLQVGTVQAAGPPGILQAEDNPSGDQTGSVTLPDLSTSAIPKPNVETVHITETVRVEVPVEVIVPVTQTVFVTETVQMPVEVPVEVIVPVTQTVFVTETVLNQ